ncbi:MAG: hypothetical protein OEN00_11750 [Gemmatimonadota bacterium]|nr:hypothetical protein [Gemmatimonadota bacterium]
MKIPDRRACAVDEGVAAIPQEVALLLGLVAHDDVRETPAGISWPLVAGQGTSVDS